MSKRQKLRKAAKRKTISEEIDRHFPLAEPTGEQALTCLAHRIQVLAHGITDLDEATFATSLHSALAQSQSR